MGVFSKKKKDDYDDEESDDEDAEEIAEARNRKPIKEKNEPSPLSKQEVGELINANIVRFHELFNYYRNMLS